MILCNRVLPLILVSLQLLNGGLAFRTSNVVRGEKLRAVSTISSKEVVTNPRNNGPVDVSAWHKERRKLMLKLYGEEIAALEKDTSQDIGIPLLVLTNASLISFSLWSGSLSVPGVVILAWFTSILSLWQLQILHDVVHGSFVSSDLVKSSNMSRKDLQNRILFWGSMPSYFGYYLYLKYGHLTHHKNTGQHSVADVFASDQVDFEDGDVLFTAHRMQMTGDYGPQFEIGDTTVKMSISKSGFVLWQEDHPEWNACMFVTSFLFERIMLGLNDVVVAATGKNFFFLNKPEQFQQECADYARIAVAVRATLLLLGGPKSVIYLYLVESLWSLPPHPACAMFVTNHGSVGEKSECVPTSSTYTGAWYSMMTLGTNFHCEHHDFPTIPFHKLYRLRQIAPEFYSSGNNDNLWSIMKRAFSNPDFYACMNANGLQRTKRIEQTNK